MPKIRIVNCKENKGTIFFGDYRIPFGTEKLMEDCQAVRNMIERKELALVEEKKEEPKLEKKIAPAPEVIEPEVLKEEEPEAKIETTPEVVEEEIVEEKPEVEVVEKVVVEEPSVEVEKSPSATSDKPKAASKKRRSRKKNS